MTNILVLTKTSSEDVRLRQTYSSWSRRLQDVRKTSSEDEDERRLDQDECLLDCNVATTLALPCHNDATIHFLTLPQRCRLMLVKLWFLTIWQRRYNQLHDIVAT